MQLFGGAGTSDNPAAAAQRKALVASNAKNMNPDGTLNVAKANADPSTLAGTNALFRETLPDDKKAGFDASQPLKPPPPGPDLADQLLRKAGATTLLRQQAKQGRKSSFLTGSMGDAAAPLLTSKTTLGSY